MNIRLSTCFAAIVGVLLASCYPVDENPKDKPAPKTPNKTATAQDAQKLKDLEAAKKKEKEKEQAAQDKPAEKTDTAPEKTTTENTKPPTTEPKRDYAFANKVPGKEGFVFSPYNNKVVDVRDIPSGTLVQDPTYPAAEKKYFRVP